MAITKNILFISYFAGVDANCPAEWADDRLRAMKSMDLNTIVLTNYGSSLQDADLISVYKTPSISSDDFLSELMLRHRWSAIRGSGEYILRGIVFIFGSTVKVLTNILTRGGSGGKWSWLISATPVGIWIGLSRPIDKIYCTGGPPSAYFVGLIVSWITRKPLKIEFQDPLVGAKINSSSYKQLVVRAVERLLLKRAALSVYVTKKAADDAKARNPDLAHKVIHNYPAAWPHVTDVVRKPQSRNNHPLQILHLGTLYGSRNLDKLFSSLDKLYENNYVKVGGVQVINLGSVYTDNAETYHNRQDFRNLAERGRLDALKIAANADFLLLIQHNDDRSAETIPYKLYDYLNLNIPIILLIKNPEIRELYKKYPMLIADCGDDAEIGCALKAAIAIFSQQINQNIFFANNDVNNLNINNQIAKILFSKLQR